MGASRRVHWRHEIPRAKLRIPALDRIQKRPAIVSANSVKWSVEQDDANSMSNFTTDLNQTLLTILPMCRKRRHRFPTFSSKVITLDRIQRFVAVSTADNKKFVVNDGAAELDALVFDDLAALAPASRRQWVKQFNVIDSFLIVHAANTQQEA